MPRIKDAFLNYFPIGYIPFLKKIQTTKFREMFSPEEREANFQEFRASVGLVNGLNNTNVFKKYQDERVDSLDKLAKLKTGDDKSDPIKIDGETITERLNNTSKIIGPGADAVPEIRAAYAEALELTEETKQALKELEEEIKALNEIIKRDPPEFSLSAIAARLQDIRARAAAILEKQQKSETEKITALFEPPKAATMKDAKRINDEQLADLKKNELDVLKKKHGTEKSAVDKSMEQEIQSLFNFSQTEHARISFLKSLYENSEFMKEMIDKLHAEELKKLKAQGMTDELIMAMGPEMVKSIANTTLKNIGIGDLKQIETETGLIIDVRGEKDNISLHVQLPVIYNKERYLSTMTTLAMSCRACGYENCTITINEKDEEAALRAARLAYEGQAIAGYPPEKRFIVVNGKTKKLEEMFPPTKDGLPNTKLAMIDEKYKRDQEKTESYEKKSPLEEQERLKSAIQQERVKQNTPPQQVPGLQPDAPQGLAL